MASTKSKKRVIREDVKDKHTSHWDQDMLSWSELEALMQSKTLPSGPETDVDISKADPTTHNSQTSE